MSPSCTGLPESKLIRATVPGRSALTVTPWTASMVPITDMVEGHCSRLVTTLVTASGGGWKAEACTADSICRNLTKPKPPRRIAITPKTRINLLAISPPYPKVLFTCKTDAPPATSRGTHLIICFQRQPDRPHSIDTCLSITFPYSAKRFRALACAGFAVGPETASPSQVRYLYDERGPQKSTGV